MTDLCPTTQLSIRLDPPLHLGTLRWVGDGGDVLHDVLAGLRLAGPALTWHRQEVGEVCTHWHPAPWGAPHLPPTRDDDAGVLGTALHGLVGGISQREEVRRALVELTTPVLLHHRGAVQLQRLVGVHGHHHLPNVGVDAAL